MTTLSFNSLVEEFVQQRKILADYEADMTTETWH